MGFHRPPHFINNVCKLVVHRQVRLFTSLKYIIKQARSQDFSWGGAYLNNRDQIINFGMIRYASSEDTEGRVSNLQSQMGTTFNGTGKCYERRRREPLGRSGACSPRKFSNLKALKRHFQHSQANSCVKKVPKIDRYFLNFDKNCVIISCSIFS